MLSTSTSNRLATQLDALAVLLKGVSPQALDRRPATGKWSARENLAHLARYHEVFLERLRRIRSEDRPSLPRYLAEEDPEWPNWKCLPADEVLRRIKPLRSELVEFVSKLSAADLGRNGIHSNFGEMPLPLWIEFFLVHEAHHLYVILQRARSGG